MMSYADRAAQVIISVEVELVCVRALQQAQISALK